MVNDIFDADHTDFTSFVDKYVRKLEEDSNRIVEVRCFDNPFKNKLTIINPRVKLNDELEFVPAFEIPHSQKRYFYSTRKQYKVSRTAFYMKVTTYKVEDYKGSGLEFSFDVINKISAVIETNADDEPERDFPDIIKEAEHRDKSYPFASQNFDMISYKENINGCPVENVFYSDKVWEDRLQYKKARFLPFILLPYFLTGDAYAKCSYNPNSYLDSDSDSMIVPKSQLLNEEYEVNTDIGSLFADFTWLQNEDEIVSQFVDTSIMRFLVNYEIPIWASICANSLQRPIKDHELHFMNESLLNLTELHTRNLNSMTELAIGLFHEFNTILTDFNILNRCDSCGSLMRYRHNKKYCSVASEGIDCGKKQRSSNYYIKHQKRISEYYRGEMRKTRELMKSLQSENSK